MADAYGSVKSNSFKVKDFQAFAEWFSSLDAHFGAAELDIYGESEDEHGKYITIGDPDAQYPDIIPINIDDDEERLTEFVEGIRQHMLEDQVFCLMAQSNEKLVSQVCSRLIVTHEGYRIDIFDTDDSAEKFKELVKERNDEKEGLT